MVWISSETNSPHYDRVCNTETQGKEVFHIYKEVRWPFVVVPEENGEIVLKYTVGTYRMV